MRFALRGCVTCSALLLVAATLGLASDPAAQQLFNRVRAKVLDNAKRMPRYTCIQTVERTEYRPQYGMRPANCEDMIAARARLDSPGFLVWHDRLRLDVAVVDGEETFSWAGARQFETTDLQRLTSSGSSGSGDFASFLYSVFGMEATRIAFLGQGLFGFSVPVEQSGYRYRSHGTGASRKIGFHGVFLVDEDRADLERLTVDVDHFPPDEQACRVEHAMDYHRVKIGNGDFLLPETSTMTVLFHGGKEARNETHYSECREYVGESTIHFGDDPVDAASPVASKTAVPAKLPPHLRLRIGLMSPINSETGAAGDEVAGIVLRDVKGFVHENDVVHGRILRLEQDMFPIPRWTVAIRFDAIERNGVEQPIDLKPAHGGGLFTFRERGNLVLDRKFHSEWETR